MQNLTAKTLVSYILLIFIVSSFITFIKSDNGIAAAIATTTTPASLTGCQLSKASKHEQSLFEMIKPLSGDKFSVMDKDHTYYFTVCGPADNSKNKDEGFVQMNMATNKTFVLGRLNDVDLEGFGGSLTVVRLVYNNGDTYANSCSKSERSTVVYITCSKQTLFKMVEENNERNSNCHYVFELYTPKICTNSSTKIDDDSKVEPVGTTKTSVPTNPITPVSASATTTTSTTTSTITTTTTTTTLPTNKPSTAATNSTAAPTSSASQTTTAASSSTKSKLGFFSIAVIIFGSFIFVYVIIGTIYLRFVRQARGWEQVPHNGAFRILGSRTMACCNYVLRCGKKPSEIHSYDNINDRMSDDENLLNF